MHWTHEDVDGCQHVDHAHRGGFWVICEVCQVHHAPDNIILHFVLELEAKAIHFLRSNTRVCMCACVNSCVHAFEGMRGQTAPSNVQKCCVQVSDMCVCTQLLAHITHAGVMLSFVIIYNQI